MRHDWRRINFVLLICAALQHTGEGHLAAFTPLQLQELGLTGPEIATWTGLLYATMMGVAFPLAPFWGPLSERYSRRVMVLRSFFIAAVTYVICAFAPNVGVLVVSRVLLGLTMGNISMMTATQAMITPRRQLGTAIAVVQAAQPIAASLGPPLGALAIPHIGVSGLFLADAVLVALAGIAIYLIMPEPPRSAAPASVLSRTRGVLAFAWSTPPIRWNLSSAGMLRFATSVIDSYLPVRITQVTDNPAPAIGWILGIYGALSSVATWAVGKIVDRIEEGKLFLSGMIGGTLLSLGMAVVPELGLLGLLAALRAFPAAMGNSVLYTHLARVVPREHQTAVMSLGPVPRNVGAFLGPAVAAAVANLFPGAGLLVGGIGYAISILTGWALVTRTPARAILEQRFAVEEAQSSRLAEPPPRADVARSERP
ncbi:MAG: MFS transporter [Chloroflexi bacterium]|nr:MFS transporter [Chloroflexota bacterium]